MHRLLQRQIKRIFGDDSKFTDEMREFINSVDEAYKEFDVDRAMLERSLELSSLELSSGKFEHEKYIPCNPRSVFQT